MKIKGLFKYSGFAIFMLLCLSLFTLSRSYDASAKYKSTVQNSTGASVAKWDVSIEPVSASNVLNMVTGSTPQDYIIKVKSLSEVSSNYSIIVTNVPNDITVAIDDGAGIPPTNNSVTFSNAGVFTIGNGVTERQHKLTFSAPLSSNATTSQVDIQVAFAQTD